MFVCGFNISTNSVLFCLFSLLYVLGYISCRSIIQLSKCLRLQKHLCMFFLPITSVPINPTSPSQFLFLPSLLKSLTNWVAFHLPSYSQQTFGTSPIPRVSSVTLVRCSLLRCPLERRAWWAHSWLLSASVSQITSWQTFTEFRPYQRDLPKVFCEVSNNHLLWRATLSISCSPASLQPPCLVDVMHHHSSVRQETRWFKQPSSMHVIKMRL